MRGRVADVPLPKAPTPPPKTAVPLPKASSALSSTQPLPVKAQTPVKAATLPVKTASQPVATPSSATQPPRRPSDAFNRPASTSDIMGKPQFTRDLTGETEALQRKLNSAARDIVEVIDSELPRDLERRFTGGEGGVYTHHLLENRIARLPRIIEGRYTSERVVRSRVDAYIRLFERLLDTFAEAPQGDRLVDTSLASESGKLYLLLAKASGRISAQ